MLGFLRGTENSIPPSEFPDAFGQLREGAGEIHAGRPSHDPVYDDIAIGVLAGHRRAAGLSPGNGKLDKVPKETLSNLPFGSVDTGSHEWDASRVRDGAHRRRAGCHELCSLRMRPVNGFEIART